MDKRIVTMGMVLSLGLAAYAPGVAQTPKAAIGVVALSPQELHELGWVTEPSSGLKVVGKGEIVYLSGLELSGQQITSYLWSFASRPAGSNAAFDSTASSWTTFRPDTTGTFTVKLSITTAGGASDTTVNIVSAKYVGVGTVGGQTPDVTKGQCAVCHSDKASEWANTRHASKFQREISGLGSSHYNASCVRCHTVGYNDAPAAVNGGFDDVAIETGWQFPATLVGSNWDDIVNNFPTLAAKANIQCENCHGPGSLHFGDKSKIDISLDEGMCGRCHEEEPYHVKNVQWKQSLHSVGVAFASTNPSCAGCHSGYGYIKRIDTGNRLSQSTGFPQISCAVCHDPHSPNNPKQLRQVADVTLNNGETVSFGGDGRFCMSCHISRRNADTYVQQYADHFGPHHSNQTDMLAGTNAITFGMPIPTSKHKDVVPDLCVTCHMAPTPANGEPGHNKIGEHTWAMHTDNGTPDDPSDDADNVAACKTCHGNVNSFEDFIAKEDYDNDGTVEPAEDEIQGLLDEVGKLLPPLGDPAVNVTPDYTPLQLRAAYNHAFVADDGSHGFHNYQFAVNLLKVAFKALTTGDIGAGNIMKIADVPNDQGRQVRISWTRFGGDGVSNMPVKYYAIWRRIDEAPAMGKQTPQAKAFDSIEQMFEKVQELKAGTVVRVQGQSWDFAGTVPAAGLAEYNAIAPTLMDSTKVDGMHWSVFMITGHTELPAIFAASAPDSGYSVDNLAPLPPMNLLAKEVGNGVELTWTEPTDQDYKYTALYRSTTSGFDPNTVEPIVKLSDTKYVDTDVQVGTTYFYRAANFDFSGNRSGFTGEFSTAVTAVPENSLSGIPTEYMLMQNYPNPFNPSTVIRFGLPEASDVRLVIYNMLGSPVRELVSGRLAAGQHSITWDGRDDNGRIASTGTYIYRLETSSVSLIRKMVFVQ